MSQCAVTLGLYYNVPIEELPRPCGGCRGLGGHSPRCQTQPGAMWRRLADLANSLGDQIGPNDPEAANTAWHLAARLRKRADDA